MVFLLRAWLVVQERVEAAADGAFEIWCFGGWAFCAFGLKVGE